MTYISKQSRLRYHLVILDACNQVRFSCNKMKQAHVCIASYNEQYVSQLKRNMRRFFLRSFLFLKLYFVVRAEEILPLVHRSLVFFTEKNEMLRYNPLVFFSSFLTPLKIKRALWTPMKFWRHLVFGTLQVGNQSCTKHKLKKKTYLQILFDQDQFKKRLLWHILKCLLC